MKDGKKERKPGSTKVLDADRTKGVAADRLQKLEDHKKAKVLPAEKLELGVALGTVDVTFLFGDEEAFRKKTTVPGFVPGKGQAMIPSKEVITAAARNLFNIMSGLDQKSMAIHINDNGPFEIKVDKQMRINIGQLPPAPDNLLNEEDGESKGDMEV